MSAVAVKDKAEAARARASVYHLLSMVYIKEVSADFLKALRDNGLKTTLGELGVDTDKMLPDTPEGELLDALAEEYAALFIVPGGIPPYESARLKGMLCQEPETKVRAFYKRVGLNFKMDSKIFADHLGLELEFMWFLADNEAAAFENNDKKEALRWRALQKEFFVGHINNWVFRFLGDLDMCARHPFYSEMSRLTRGFLELDKKELEISEAAA
jgi:TorA maturation chaperone TorD